MLYLWPHSNLSARSIETGFCPLLALLSFTVFKVKEYIVVPLWRLFRYLWCAFKVKQMHPQCKTWLQLIHFFIINRYLKIDLKYKIYSHHKKQAHSISSFNLLRIKVSSQCVQCASCILTTSLFFESCFCSTHSPTKVGETLRLTSSSADTDPSHSWFLVSRATS